MEKWSSRPVAVERTSRITQRGTKQILPVPLHDLTALTRDVVLLEPTVENVGDTHGEGLTDANNFFAVELRLQIVSLHLASIELLNVIRVGVHHLLAIER